MENFDSYEDGEADNIIRLPYVSENEHGNPTGMCRPGRAPNIERHRAEGASRLFCDYLGTSHPYDDPATAHRLCVSSDIFMEVRERFEMRYKFFQQQEDATGKKELNAIKKCTTAIFMLVYWN